MIYILYLIERFFYKIKLVPIAFFIRGLLRLIFSCDIPYKAKIGKHCDFPHYALGVLIHPGVQIGDNCKILHGVTIGGRAGHEKVPVIGNNVLIGAHAVIIGPVNIGNNVKIGAGSIVVKDVPDNKTVVGNPARIIEKRVK